MAKWNVVLSTTEPYNYIGIINVRQGNRNSEVMEAIITEMVGQWIFRSAKYLLKLY